MHSDSANSAYSHRCEDLPTCADALKRRVDVACAKCNSNKKKSTNVADSNQDDVPNWLDAIGHCVAGGLAGIVSMALIYPIDTMKTRMQVEQPPIPGGVSGWKLVKTMYAGLGIGLTETGVVHGTSFLAFEFIKGLFLRASLGRGLEPGEEPPEVPLPVHVMLGCLASLSTQLVTMPLKVVLVRVQSGNASGVVSASRALYAEGGIGAFFQGARAAFVVMVNPAMTYVVYERLRSWFVSRRRASLSPTRPTKDSAAHPVVEMPVTGAEQLAAGFIAKAIATVVTYPALKAQAMVMSSSIYRGSLVRAMLAVIREGGQSLSALWRGVVPKLLQAALQQALIFRFKEPWAVTVLILLRKHWYKYKSR
eukprot:m.207839 g.207839  ORF g.207839 m.207839 type:complete len:365 (-) comp18944_c0_seq7:128-1222(-)